MTLNSRLSSDVSIFFDTDDFAQSVTYAGTAIDAIADYDKNLDDAGSNPVAFGTLLVKQSDVSDPAYRDVVVIDSVTWYVRRIISGDGQTWELEIYRGESPVWA